MDSGLQIIGYSDSIHGNLDLVKMAVIFLCGYRNMSVPLNWQLKVIGRVVRSSLAAETLTLSDALDDVVYLMKLFSEIMFKSNYKNTNRNSY